MSESDHRDLSRASRMEGIGELTITSEREGDVHSISLIGELDLATAAQLEAELERVEATDVAAIVVDLSGLTFMDSTGVRILLEADARSRADSNRLTLLRGCAAVQRVLKLSGIEEMLPFAD